MKITMSHIKDTLKQVNEACGLKLQVTRFAPGDGWARYSIQQVNSPTSSYELVNSLTAIEMINYLRGMHQLARMQQEIKYEVRHSLSNEEPTDAPDVPFKAVYGDSATERARIDGLLYKYNVDRDTAWEMTSARAAFEKKAGL